MDSSAEQQNGISNEIIRPYDIAGRSIASEKHPDRNEDAISLLPHVGIVGVFDGVGGHGAGDRASRLAKDAFENLVTRRVTPSVNETKRCLQDALNDSNQAVLDERRDNPFARDCATTATVAKLWEGPNGERKAIIVSIGDSRAYLLRRGELQQITIDDSIVVATSANPRATQELLALDPKKWDADARNLNNKRNNLTQALGIADHFNTFEIDLEEGDKIILTSDGIHDNLADNEIKKTLKGTKDSQDGANQLVTSALERSREQNHPRSKPDDISAVVIDIKSKLTTVPNNRRSEDQLLTVERSDGRKDGGWRVVGEKEGIVELEKEENGQILGKSVAKDELVKLNRNVYGESDKSKLSTLRGLLGKISGK